MQNTEQKAADALLDKGVKFPLSATWWMRIFGKKTINVTLRQPHTGTLYRISGLYLLMDVDPEKLNELGMKEGYQLFHDHAKTICRIIALALLRGYWKGKLFSKPVARYLFVHATPKDLCNLLYVLVMFSGIGDFCNTIRLTSTMKMTTPRNLSPEEKGS